MNICYIRGVKNLHIYNVCLYQAVADCTAPPTDAAQCNKCDGKFWDSMASPPVCRGRSSTCLCYFCCKSLMNVTLSAKAALFSP